MKLDKFIFFRDETKKKYFTKIKLKKIRYDRDQSFL